MDLFKDPRSIESIASMIRASLSSDTQRAMHNLLGSIALYNSQHWLNHSIGFDTLVTKSWLNKNSLGVQLFCITTLLHECLYRKRIK
jgi:hypothetical protein